MSNIDPSTPPANVTAAEHAATKLVTDGVAAVIDESSRRGATTLTTAELTDRLAAQFKAIPGFDEADFRARASASATADQYAAAAPDRGTRKLDASARKAESEHRSGNK